MAFRAFLNWIPRYSVARKCCTSRNLLSDVLSRYTCSSRFDPPYLSAMKPKIPVYDAINVQIKGYDFALVESYQSLVHNIAKTMELDVEDSWAVPAANTKVNRFKPLSAVVDSEYNLTTYERNVQVVDLPSSLAPVFIELLQTSLPQGLTVTLLPHTPEQEEIRYVPDYELDELKVQLEAIIAARKK